jgi:creatinine amidohydrolase
MSRFCLLTILATGLIQAQPPLSVKWEELTAPDFIAAIQKAKGTCLVPFGVVEKHGPHLPLGTDLFVARWAAVEAAGKDYAVVFPEYYFGQIFYGRHEPGTISYSATLQMQLLQETTDEMARNGCKKIMFVSGHGGNSSLLHFFTEAQLDKPRDYQVYGFSGGMVNAGPEFPGGAFPRTPAHGHAGDRETGWALVARPELVRLEKASSQSGKDLNRQQLPPHVFNALNEFANFPEHYSGDGSLGTKALGESDMNNWVKQIVTAIRWVKADNATPKLQEEFQEKARHPLETKQ